MSEQTAYFPGWLTYIKLANIFSFGTQTQGLEVKNLNVLVGPNGSGKSNLIEALALMRATIGDLHSVLRKGGGVKEWIFKGGTGGTAKIRLHFNVGIDRTLSHVLTFGSSNNNFYIDTEKISGEYLWSTDEKDKFEYHYEAGESYAFFAVDQRREIPRKRYEPFSILALRRDPDAFADFASLAEGYEAIRIYREWSFGRNTIFRQPQPADMRNDRLEEDFSNLGLVLNRIRRNPRSKAAVLSGLRNLYNEFSDFDVIVEGGTVQVFFTEGDYVIPATRLSDGTLRYLCLLAILCDPTPPPLICIEEPELGLHPDILPKLADLIKEASQRTQLIITTHSDMLVDCFSDQPEAVVVFEKHQGQTEMRRLQNDDEFAEWLGQYRLGQLWLKGYIGGTRW